MARTQEDKKDTKEDKAKEELEARVIGLETRQKEEVEKLEGKLATQKEAHDTKFKQMLERIKSCESNGDSLQELVDSFVTASFSAEDDDTVMFSPKSHKTEENKTGKGLGEDDDIKKDALGHHNAWNELTYEGITSLMKLRFSDIEDVKVVSAGYDIENGSIDLSSLASTIRLVNESTILVPINVENKHWVGLVFKKSNKHVDVKFIDSEGGEIPAPLVRALEESFEDISIYTSEVEKQIANNCGYQVIETFAHDVLGESVTQKEVVAFYSCLVGQDLIQEAA